MRLPRIVLVQRAQDVEFSSNVGIDRIAFFFCRGDLFYVNDVFNAADEEL